MKGSIRFVILISFLLFCSLVSVGADQILIEDYQLKNMKTYITLSGDASFYKNDTYIYYGSLRNNLTLDINAESEQKPDYFINAKIEIYDDDTGSIVGSHYYYGTSTSHSFNSLPKNARLKVWIESWIGKVYYSTHNAIYRIMRDDEAPSITLYYNARATSGPIVSANDVNIIADAADNKSGIKQNSMKIKVNDRPEMSSDSTIINFDGVHIVTFSTTDNVGNATTKSISITIDKTGPVITVTANHPIEWIDGYGRVFANGTVEFTATAHDDISGVDTKTWQNASNGDFSLSPEGEQMNKVTVTEPGNSGVQFRVKDKLGNLTKSEYFLPIIDESPPIIAILGDDNSWSANPTTTLYVSVGDNYRESLNLEYSLDDGATWIGLAIAESHILLDITGEGKHTIVFRLRDRAGNETRATRTINIDTLGPEFVLSIDGYVRKEADGWAIPFRVSDIYDAAGASDYPLYYSLDGASSVLLPGSALKSTYKGLISGVFFSGSTHTLEIFGSDKLGNRAKQTVEFTVDTAPPDIQPGLNLGENAEELSWTNQDRFEYTVTDTESGVKIHSVDLSVVLANGFLSSINEYTVTENTVIFTDDAMDGIYHVLVKATDNANNNSEKVFYYKLDRTPPEISPTLIKSGTGSVTVTGTDKASGLDENCWSSPMAGVSGTGGYTIELSEGLHEREFTLRDIAGNSTTQKVVIYIDMSPPEITLTLPEYGIHEKLPVTINVTDSLTEITGEWYLLDGIKTAIDKARWKFIEIPLASYAEGYHTIRAGAVDEMGNSGEGEEYRFIIDRTPPKLNGVELRDVLNRDRIIGKDDYIGGGGLLVKVAGEDRFIHDAEERQGHIKSYFWDHKRDVSETPVFVSGRQSEENEFIVENLSDGLNYLFIRAGDGAENPSNILDFTVLQDQSNPGSPMIWSATHAEADRPEQAGSLSRGEFSFTPAFEMKSGIKGYQWKVEKLVVQDGYEGIPEFVQEGQIVKIDQEGKGNLSIELDDNGENEFYNLLVRCIGGNTKTGSWAKYRFRSDTEAPGELRIQAVPQAESLCWYNQWDTVIRWNKPSDMTGVAEYRYLLLPEEDSLDSPPEEWDIASWNNTTGTEVSADLRNILNGKKSGSVRILVSAVDYAGNRKFGENSFKYDFVPPEFENSYIAITDAEDYMGKGKRIRWNRLSDSESGIDHVTVLISDEDRIRTYTVEPEINEYIVSPLDDDRVYTVVVRGYDRAGNQSELYTVFATGTAVVPDSYSVPYLENINGYQLSGRKCIESKKISFKDITLLVPEALNVFTVTAVGGVEIREPLGEISFGEITVKDGTIERGQTNKGRYELNAGGFILEGEAIGFSRIGGLILENAVYTRPMVVSGLRQEKAVQLGSVIVGFPPLIQLSSGDAAIGIPVRIENISGVSQGFPLTGVESLALRNGKEWFSGSEISFDRKQLTNHAIYLGDPAGAESVKLRDSSMDSGSHNLNALLDIPVQKPLSLTMGKAVYVLKKAGIRGTNLDIYEAVLSLPAGYEPRELVIRNFTIDGWNGLVNNGRDFSAGNIRVTSPNGTIFEGTKTEFDLQGNLLVSGTISSEVYGTYRTENTILTNTGIDWENGAGVTDFTTDIHGFLVTANKAWITAEGILIPEGVINIWDSQQVITGLGLGNNKKDEVWRDGTILGGFSGDPGYGGPIQISAGKITGNGVFGTATLPLGDGITDQAGAGHWDFPWVQLEPNGAIAGEYEGEKLLIIAGNRIKVENVSFDGELVRIGKGSVEGIPNLNPAAVIFKGLEFNYRGISSEGVSGGDFKFAASGWEINYTSLRFDSFGITGRGSLRLPEKLGGLSIEFPETRISANGLFTSNTLDGIQGTICLHQIPLSADGVSLKLLNDNYVLEIAYPLVSLEEINGPDILFGSVIFDSGGTVLAGENEKRRIDFTSANNYLIGVENSRIENDGFILEGGLTLQWSGRNIPIPKGNFRILPDYSITGTVPDTEFLYQLGDWSISGRDIQFDIDRIRIGYNRIFFREIEIDIGEIPLSLGGKLLQGIVQKQDLGISLLGTVAKITETRFSDEGIEATVIVVLPAYLGGKSLVFDTVGFQADGGFLIEKKIDQFGFTVLDFSFGMEEITLDKLGLHAAQASITLPESMERISLGVQDLRISNTGTVSIGSAEISPFTLWNMKFSLNNFSIVNEEVNFAGNVCLPKTIQGELSEREIQIRDFKVKLDGSILSLDIYLDGEYTAPLTEAWALLFRNVRVIYSAGQPWITADRVKLLFPQEYPVQDAYVEKVKFNLLTGQFAFSEFRIDTAIPMSFLGIDFILSGLSVTPELTLRFSGSAYFSNPELPAFLTGKTVDFRCFEIRSDGTLGTIQIDLEGLEGGIIPGVDGLVLKKGHISLIKEEDKSLILDIGGNITLNSPMPAGLAGAALKIETFTFDTAAGEIKRLKASVVLPTADLLGNFFSKLSIGIDWNEAKQTGFFNLSGDLSLPSSFPAFLAGKKATISNFKIGFDGAIQSFTAKYSTEKNKAYDAFGFLQLSDVVIVAALKSGVMKFDLAGTVILPADKFPQGVGGLRTSIAMEYDTSKGLESVSAVAALPGQKLFGTMDLRNGMAGISKSAGKSLEISVGGELLLPDFFPAGLRGIAVGIQKFTINTSGEIQDINISAFGLNVKIFGMADITNGNLNFKKGTGNEFLITMGGSIRLSNTGLPDSIRNASLVIRSLELSTRDGLTAFDVGINSEISISILGGILVNVSSLNLNESGVSISAGAKLPSNYPNGLANARIFLKALKIGWNGSIQDISGGLGAWSMSIAGFTAAIDELFFEKDTSGQFWVTLKSCRIQIPPNFGNFGGQYVGIKNAKINPNNGTFLGDIAISKLETEIAGFKLIMDKPSLEFSEEQIGFSKVTLKLPDFLGKGEIALNKVKLSASSGLQVSGGAIKLPKFSIGALAFSDVRVNFTMSASDYSLEGGGSVLIPGAGNIAAVLGFTTVSVTYPIGLKQAYFSYTLAMGGIPLGNTGLFINGISGGIAYGPPDEVPGIAKGLFSDKGPRITVGLHVGDVYGGTILDMNPAVWVDISNGTWAFEGNAMILRGKLDISARVTAAMGSKGFVGETYVKLAFVEGGVSIYVFDKSGRTIFSGEGVVKFSIAKGAIIDAWIIQVPPSSLWIAEVGAAFGQFNNGKSGFKGTVNLPVVGTVGVFVGPGTFDFGSLSSYTIEKPSWIKSVQISGDQDISSLDRNDRSGNEDVSYQMFVPPRGRDVTAPLSMLHEEYDGTGEVLNSGLDRLIVLLEYIEGAPQLTVRSPSGIEYREGGEGTETIVEENGTILVIHSAEAGIWQLRVNGLAEEAYRLSALGNMAMPMLEIREPAAMPEKVTGEVRVCGITEQGRTGVRIFAQEETGLPGLELGTFAVDPDGQFDLKVPIQDLNDGEYLIYAQLEGPDEYVSPTAYAPGKIVVDRSDIPMLAPGGLRVAETDSGILTLHWQNTNGGRTEGYKVKLRNNGEGTESIVYVGNITSLSFPGYTPGEEMSFAVTALDNKYREGPWSEQVFIRLGGEKPIFNRPVALAERFQVRGFSGGFIEGIIKAGVENFLVREDASGYIGVRYTGPEQNLPLTIHFGSPVKVHETTVEIPWYMGIPESVGPALYEYPCEFFNEANAALNSAFTLAVEINWPMPEITAVEPSEINGTSENILTVYGNSFVPGTRAFWEDEELVIENDGSRTGSGSMRIVLPPRSGSEVKQTNTEKGELIIQGPGGDRAVFPITVLLPGYKIALYTRIAETVPGGSVDYALALSSINGFDGTVSFKVLNKPEDLEILLPVITVNSTGSAAGVIGVHAGENARAGSYTSLIEGEGGRIFELVTIVQNTPLAPRLSSVVPSAAFTSDEVHLHGYGLGSQGTLFLNGRDIPVSRWSEGEIIFVVPHDGLSGKIHVLSAGGESNALTFTVKDRGFAIHPGTDRLELSAREEKIFPIAVTGYADTVTLDIICEPGAPFTASLDRDELKPNARINMRIRTESFAGNGIWRIIIRGTSRGFESDAEITVHIGNSFSITTTTLPDGLVEVSYYGELSSRNAGGEVAYRVIGGSLPPGLTMTPRGIISGRPLEPGQYRMDIEAQDTVGWKDVRSFTIKIWEEVWGQEGKDGGQISSVRTDIPANNDTAWIYEGNEMIVQIIGAENRIIALGRDNLTALRAIDGHLSWKVKGKYEKALYAGGKLYALTGEGLLEVRDPLSGVLLWSREEIQAISSDGTIIIEETKTRRFLRNAERGILIEEQRKDTETPVPVIWRYGTAYLIRETKLIPIYGSGKPWEAGEKILAAAMDLQGGAAIIENSLILFDGDMKETRRISCSHHSGVALSLTDEGVSVLDNGTLWSYDREDLTLQWIRRINGVPVNPVPANGEVLGNGLEKTVIAGREGLVVLNRYTGDVIWRDEKPYNSFALYHERIFAVDTGGTIRAFNGTANAAGPETEIRIEDNGYAGLDGWYTGKPVVEITSADRETYVAAVMMRHNDGPWEDAPPPFLAEDGEHRIIAYGVDSRGLRGAEVQVQLRVDTELPESTITLSPEEPESGWYSQALTLILDARDDVSGIGWIWTSTEGSTGNTVSSYGGPMVLADQGMHRFSWYALDRAGNREETQWRDIRIDLEPPYAEASVVYDQAIGKMTVNAWDPLSGIAVIEYRINHGSTEQYREPLLFTEPGAYKVSYRAVDRAGNAGPWQNSDVVITPNNSGVVLIESPLINGMPRPVIGHARNGMPLIGTADRESREFSRSDPEAMVNLPSYTLGAEYILWEEGDAQLNENARIRFQLRRNAVVYLFMPQNTTAPGGWGFVEDKVRINRNYYPGGATVYMRHHGPSGWVEIPGTSTGMVQPLIMVQEKGSLGADILIYPETVENAEPENPVNSLTLDALVRPWQYSRRLPLRKRWFVNTGDGWILLEGNRYETSANSGGETVDGAVSVPLRFRLELYTPDGEVEYRIEKVYGIGDVIECP